MSAWKYEASIVGEQHQIRSGAAVEGPLSEFTHPESSVITNRKVSHKIWVLILASSSTA